MKVKTINEFINSNQKPEILFWVGCAGSYDDRYKKVTKSFVSILNHLQIDFAVLGDEEGCTGDPARRAGNEYLFQMQALNNITNLNKYNIEKIVTMCPHCFNTLKNEYPELGGNYDVIHHTEFLNELLEEGRLISKKTNINITYHDSCYLGRGNKIYEAPRNLIKSLSKNLHEMKRKKENGLCCGAGGSQIFKESESGNVEINLERINDIQDVNPDTVAVACPFCMTMINDGVKERNLDHKINVKDISEIIEENLKS
ncbi:MAG: (Fe-S)-binding protein [Bacteroidota bacterium]|nr:(Fe-S)-binding protein [Bacteroidota bacterium]